MPDQIVKTVNGIAPDANGNVNLGGNPIMVLNLTQPVPEGVPSGTIIVRTAGAETTPVVPPVTPPIVQFGPVADSVKTATTVSGTTVTLSKPDNLVAGDVLVATFHNSSQGTTFTPPAGWETLSYLQSEPSLRLTPILTYRVTDPATVPDSWAFTASGSGRMLGAIFVVKGAATTGSLVSGTSRPAPNSGAIATVPSYSLSGKSLVLLVGAAQITTANSWGLPTTVSDSGFTKLAEITSNEAAVGTATQSTLSVYSKVVDGSSVPELTVSWANAVSTRSAVSAGLKAAV